MTDDGRSVVTIAYFGSGELKKLQNFSYQNQDRHSQILRNQINELFTTEEGRQALAYCHIHNLFQVTFMSVMIQN